MRAAPHPLNEKLRLDALLSTRLLDSMSEKEFDNITFLASLICKTPIALISLVDKDRQWFKSKIGIEVQETPRDYSFCAHAILEDDIFIVENSHQDERFKDNPLVTGSPHVVFYAGAALIDPISKLPIGTLCVIDSKERRLDKEQVNALRVLSDQITTILKERHDTQKIIEISKNLKFHAIAAENMHEGLLVQDKEGRFIHYNPSTLNILGVDSQMFLNKKSTDPGWMFLSPDGTPFPLDMLPSRLIFKTGQPQKNIRMGVRAPGEKDKWVLVNSNPIFLENELDPSYVVSTFADITELHIAQSKLIENARLISLAEMASGVAHEINNPLTIINGSCSLLTRAIENKTADEETIEKHINKIKSTVFRISKIIKGLQYFSRSAGSEPTTRVNLSEVFTDTLEMSADRFKQNEVSINYNVRQDFFVNANFIQLGQVIINLLNNSCDAIRNLKDKWIVIDVCTDNNITDIRITDSGNGITESVLAKIFLPFYTTKEIGKGTGLGLSISKGLIEEMGGSLVYDPKENKTSFVIRLKAM